MKRQYLLIALLLTICLFIYLFYRTERTLINGIVIWLISAPTYTGLKTAITQGLPLSNIIIYSLPEGLWIFCITLTSKPYYIEINRLRVNFVYIPLIFCCTLEMLQLFHLAKGQFDLMDVVIFLLCWIVGRYSLNKRIGEHRFFTEISLNTLVFVLSYSIVYLAHVF